MSVGHVRLTRGIDALFLPGALIVGWLLSRWRITRSKNSAKHSSVEVRRSNMHHFLPAVIPLALSIVLLWRTPITDPLWPSISPPVDSFMHAWHQIEWHSPASALVYVLRGVVSELVGATYESRVYFSMVTVGVSLSFYYACRFVWSACVDRSAALIVGMLAVCNGYFLQRLVLGHDRQLLGYALLPWIIGYIVRVIMHKKHRDLYIAVLLAVVAGIIAPHYVPIALVVFIVSLPFTYSVWGSAVRGLSVRWGAALAVATTICAVRVFGVTERVSEFGSDGLLAWAPRSDEFYGVITSVSGLYGYWIDGGILDVKIDSQWWALAPWLLISATVVGVLSLRTRHTRRAAYFIAALSVVALLCALGINTIITSDGGVYRILHDNWVLKGMRESLKFSSVLAVLLVMCGSYGVYMLYSTKRILLQVLAAAVIVAQLWVVSPLLRTPHEHIAQCNYPQELVDFSTATENAATVVLLPEDQYDFFTQCSSLLLYNPLISIFTKVDVESFDEGGSVDAIVVMYGDRIRAGEEPFNTAGCNTWIQTETFGLCRK